jgi:hypothetical protein
MHQAGQAWETRLFRVAWNIQQQYINSAEFKRSRCVYGGQTIFLRAQMFARQTEYLLVLAFHAALTARQKAFTRQELSYGM